MASFCGPGSCHGGHGKCAHFVSIGQTTDAAPTRRAGRRPPDLEGVLAVSGRFCSVPLMLPASPSPLDRQPVLQSKEAARKVMFDQMWTRLRADPLLDELNAAACGAEYPQDVTVFSSCTRTILIWRWLG